MIKTFKHKGLQKFYETGSAAGIQTAYATRLRLLGIPFHRDRTFRQRDQGFR